MTKRTKCDMLIFCFAFNVSSVFLKMYMSLVLDFAGDKDHHRLHHLFVMADCLYRAKNHATWLFPSIDIDEFFNMKDGSLFGTTEFNAEGRARSSSNPVVPSDYLGSSWDAIVKAKRMTRDEVHSISLPIFRFRQWDGDQVEPWKEKIFFR